MSCGKGNLLAVYLSHPSDEALFEELFGSFLFLALPILVLYDIVAGYSPVLRYLFRLYLLDAMLQLAFIGIGMYQRNRLQGLDKPQALKRSVIDTVKNLPFLYAL